MVEPVAHPFLFLAARTDRETVSYFIAPGQGNNSYVVTNLSSALGVKAVSVDDLNEITTVLDSPCASFLVARPNRRASLATQSGGNPNEVAVLLSQLLQLGMWVAITLRKPTGKEQERVRKWVDHRREANSRGHYASHTNLLVATFDAGATSQSDGVGRLAPTAAGGTPPTLRTPRSTRPLSTPPPTASWVCEDGPNGVLDQPHRVCKRARL